MFHIGIRQGHEIHICVYDLLGEIVHQAIYKYASQTSYFEYEGQNYVLVVNKYAVVCKMENVSEFLEVPQL